MKLQIFLFGEENGQLKILNNCDKRFSDFHECDEGARERIGSAKEKRYLADRESACGHFSRLSGLLTIVPILEKKNYLKCPKS